MSFHYEIRREGNKVHKKSCLLQSIEPVGQLFCFLMETAIETHNLS